MGISQAELSRRIGVSRQTFNNYELGKREADYETLLKIAEELHTSVQALLTDENLEPQNGIVLEKDNIYMIPIFKTVSAGFGAYADDQICGYEPLYFETKREAEETLAIAVKGDSMYPKIEEDDLVVVHKQDYFENGDIVVAVVCGENDGFVKRAFQTEEKLTLESINPSYPPMTFSGSKLDDIKIMGVVRKIIKSV
jgi:repressor LexA